MRPQKENSGFKRLSEDSILLVFILDDHREAHVRADPCQSPLIPIVLRLDMVTVSTQHVPSEVRFKRTPFQGHLKNYGTCYIPSFDSPIPFSSHSLPLSIHRLSLLITPNTPHSQPQGFSVRFPSSFNLIHASTFPLLEVGKLYEQTSSLLWPILSAALRCPL
jgi:hypothetical protein